jgi:hypothetical protein
VATDAWKDVQLILKLFLDGGIWGYDHLPTVDKGIWNSFKYPENGAFL